MKSKKLRLFIAGCAVFLGGGLAMGSLIPSFSTGIMNSLAQLTATEPGMVDSIGANNGGISNNSSIIYASNFNEEMTDGIPKGWKTFDGIATHVYGLLETGEQINYGWSGNTGGGGCRLFGGFSGKQNKALYWRHAEGEAGYAEYGSMVEEGLGLLLEEGLYDISFGMAAWKEQPSFTFELLDLDGNAYTTMEALAYPNMNGEYGDIDNVARFNVSVNIEQRGYYVIRFSATKGWFDEFLLTDLQVARQGGGFEIITHDETGERIKPVPKEPSFINSDDEAHGYLYNREGLAFMAGGNDWGTRASVTDQGDLIRITTSEYDDLILNWFKASNSSWYPAFADNWTGIWMDGSLDKAGARNWKFIRQENGSYKITNTYIGEDATLGLAESIDGQGGGTRLYFYAPTDAEFSGYFYDEWYFISETQKHALDAAIAYYKASEALNELISQAENEYPDIDVYEARKWYGYPDATTQELLAAKSRLEGAIKKAQMADASEENPFDITNWLQNADFSTGSIDGWDLSISSYSNKGYQRAKYESDEAYIDGFIEYWISGQPLGDGAISQTLTAMPAGKYKLTVDIIATDQNKGEEVHGAQLFATGGYIDSYQNVSTKNGVPQHFELTFFNNGSDLTLGLRTNGTNANWIAADNFTLTYYGETDVDPYQLLLEESIAKALRIFPIEDLGVLRANQNTKLAFKNIIEAAQAAEYDFASYIDSIDRASSALKASNLDYLAYGEQMDQLRNRYNAQEAMEGQEAKRISTYLFDDIIPGADFEKGSASYIYKYGNLTSKELIDEIAWAEAILRSAITANIKPGSDCSDMLINPSFKDGFTGWAVERGNIGGLSIFPNVEVYEGAVNIYQIVEGVPDGIYSLSCKAFERPALNGNYFGDEPSKVFLYMNEFQTPVQNICKDAISGEEAIDGENCFISGSGFPYDYYVDGYGWVPNSMEGASYAFMGGRYEQKVFALVEGGSMKIGLTSNGLKAHWVLWSDFKLTYEGITAEAISAIIPTYSNSLADYINNHELTDPVRIFAYDAIEKAQNMIEAEETNAEILMEALKLLNQAGDLARENDKILSQFYTEQQYLYDIVNNDPNENYLEDFYELASKMNDYFVLDNEGLAALIESMKDLESLLNMPNYEWASEYDPVDFTRMIVNPDFNRGNTEGWELNIASAYSLKYNSDWYYHYYNNEYITIDGFVEAWSPKDSGTLNDGYIRQTINNLPAGRYKLAVNLIATNQIYGTSSNVSGVYLFAAEQDSVKNRIPVATNDGAPEHFELDFIKGGDNPLTIGIETEGTTANWIAADYFTLLYYGIAEENPGELAHLDTLNIHVSKAGTLGRAILKQTESLSDVKVFTVSGNLNDDDWSIITSLNNLTDIDLSETNAVRIPNWAFNERYSLKSVKLPNNLEVIGMNAFSDCNRLTEINLPSTLTTIESGAFSYADLRSIDIPASVKTIASAAFMDNYNLTSVNFPEGLETIGSDAFRSTSLKSLTLPSSLRSIENTAFAFCYDLRSVILNEGLQSIRSGAFYNAPIREITLPSTLVYAESALSGCYDLRKVTCLSVAPPYTAGSRPWSGQECSLYVLNLSLVDYKLAEGWREFTHIYGINAIPENINITREVTIDVDSTFVGAKPNVSIDLKQSNSSVGYTASGYTEYGALSTEGNTTFSVGNFNIVSDPNYGFDRYNDYYYWGDYNNRDFRCYATLVNDVAMRADNVNTRIYLRSNNWNFLSFPYNVKVSDIRDIFGDAQWVIRKYDGQKRANGEMDDTWINMNEDDVLEAYQGYIWQLGSRGAYYYGAFDVTALNDASKNNIFANGDVEVALNDFQSEFAHNRSWNLIGNPYPSYFDIRAMEFSAPVTVWNFYNQNYEAYSPLDDDYILTPNEAFFVQRPIEQESIVFKKEGRQHYPTASEDNGYYAKKRNAASKAQRSVFNLTLSDGTKSDRTRVVINDMARMGYELDKDASKFESASASVPQLYSVNEGIHYAINERPLNNGIVSIGATLLEAGSYTIHLDTKAEATVVIEDTETGQTADLTEGDFTFTAQAGTSEARFILHIIDNGATGINSIAAGANGTELYTLDGRPVNGATAPGIYLVRKGLKFQKVYVK